jgi:hypothetical protein
MTGKAVSAVSSGVEQMTPGPRASIPMDELARRKGVRPVENPADMARDVFASDEELDEFLAFVTAARRANLA